MFRDDYNKEELQVDLGRYSETPFEKTKAFRENEQRVKKCLTYLGIKDKYMLDHFYPGFHKALESKTREHIKVAEDRAGQDDEPDALGQEQENMFYYTWVDNARSAGGASASAKPFTRTQALSPYIPASSESQPKRLKVCKFEEHELEMMCYKAFREEKASWRLIQRQKDERPNPYLEPVATAEASAQVQENKHQKE